MNKKFSALLLGVFLLSGSAALLSACNTTSGAGKDISSAGRAITNTAEEAR